MSALDALIGELTPEQKAAVEGKKQRAKTNGTKSGPVDSAWQRANDLDSAEVGDWLGLRDSGGWKCPSCESTSGFDPVRGGFKCLHERCADRGSEGFLSVVDMTAEIHRVEPWEAVNELAERFGFAPLPEREPRKNGNGHAEPPPDGDWQPSDDDDPRAPPKGKAEAPPAPKGKPLIEVMEAEQIFERVPPVAWTVQGLDLCPGAPAMLAGYGFGGKSIAAQSMALSIASGALVWGSLAATTGRVVHLDYEQGEYLTRRRYHRLLHGAELTPSDVQGRLALVCHPAIYLDDGRAETMLAVLLDGATLCIIDSLRAAAPRIEENSSDARRVLDLLGRISEATGCAIVVIHHARKASQATTSIRETIRGSGALYDACSSVLVVEGDPDEDRRTIHHVKARMSGTLADPMSLRIDDTDGGGLVVAVERAPSQEEREHGRRIAHDDRFDCVVLAEVTSGPGRSTHELACSLHKNQSRDVLPALTRLRMAGQVRSEAGPRHSDLWWPTGLEGSA